MTAIRKRLASLTLPDQFRPHLYEIIDGLADSDRNGVNDLLGELKSAVRNVTNAKAADAIQLAIDAGRNTNVATTL